jgi:hypothetical protein
MFKQIPAVSLLRIVSLALVLSPVMLAQGTFQGPGLISRGTGGVGQRSGQDVDLKYFVNAQGVYDTGLTPYAVTQDGTLVQPGALSGVEVGIGGYGRHDFRRSTFGVDYRGNFRHYPGASKYDGSNQQLDLEYTYQKSRRLAFDFVEAAGTQTFGTAFGAFAGLTDTVVNTSSILFDNRINYIQSTFTTRYALSGRTTISVGGSQYSVHRQSSALVGVNGYNLTGAISHRLSRKTIIGATYQHTHYDFPRAFGESDINLYLGNWSTTIGRDLELTISGGMFVSDVQGVQRTALDPEIAALLGISSVQTIFFKKNYMPLTTVAFAKHFRRANLTGTYTRTVSPGNGVFLTSRQEAFTAGYAYTGLKKWSLSVGGGGTNMTSLGQDLVPYTQIYATANIGYKLPGGLNIVGSYSRRHQDIEATTFRRDSSRVSLGIFFSPGELPISFH